MANLKLSGKMREIPMGNPSIIGDVGESESLLKEAISHLRIALGMHQMTFDERSAIRGEIREFIKKVEVRK